MALDTSGLEVGGAPAAGYMRYVYAPASRCLNSSQASSRAPASTTTGTPMAGLDVAGQTAPLGAAGRPRPTRSTRLGHLCQLRARSVEGPAVRKPPGGHATGARRTRHRGQDPQLQARERRREASRLARRAGRNGIPKLRHAFTVIAEDTGDGSRRWPWREWCRDDHRDSQDDDGDGEAGHGDGERAHASMMRRRATPVFFDLALQPDAVVVGRKLVQRHEGSGP
jgi:hypothetical protein